MPDNYHPQHSPKRFEVNAPEDRNTTASDMA